MALWGKTDALASVPKWLETDANNTNASNDADNAVFVDVTEAGVAANRAKGLKTPGWHLYSNAGGRHRSEVLVAMKQTAYAAGDIGAVSVLATAMVDGIVYTILTAGTTDFTTFGAADSIVGTTFTMANAPGTGTGTVARSDDTIVADA